MARFYSPLWPLITRTLGWVKKSKLKFFWGPTRWTVPFTIKTRHMKNDWKIHVVSFENYLRTRGSILLFVAKWVIILNFPLPFFSEGFHRAKETGPCILTNHCSEGGYTCPKNSTCVAKEHDYDCESDPGYECEWSMPSISICFPLASSKRWYDQYLGCNQL